MYLSCDFSQENTKFNFRTFQINFSYTYIARTYTYECTIRSSMGNGPNNIISIFIYNKLYWFFHIMILAQNFMVPVSTCDTPIHVIICNIILFRYQCISVEYYIFYFITEFRPSSAFCTHNFFSNILSCDAVRRLRIYFVKLGQFNIYRYVGN